MSLQLLRKDFPSNLPKYAARHTTRRTKYKKGDSHMKKILSIFAVTILILSMLLTAVSCGETDGGDTENGEGEEQNGKVPEEGVNTPWVDYN